MEDLITYMGYEWVLVDEGVLTIGINEDGLDEFSEINSLSLPEVGEEVTPDEVCGEVDTDQGQMNLYCPVEGRVVEINEAAAENPSLIVDDCYGDGWLFKVEPENPDQLDLSAIAGMGDEEEPD